MKKTVLLLIVLCAAVAGCRNRYNVEVFQSTDSYGEALSGHRVPQDVR